MVLNLRQAARWIALSSLLTAAVSARADLFIEPYLQNPKTDEMTVIWWTETSEPASQVEYGSGFERIGTASNELFTIPGHETRYLHRAVVGSLNPAATYDYRVRSGADVSDNYTFTTAPVEHTGFHFVVIGDGRTDNDTVIARHRAVTELALQRDPDIAFGIGDMVYDGSDQHWTRFWRRVATASDTTSPGSALASKVPYHLAVGNHEIYLAGTGYGGGNLDSTMTRFKAYCENPGNGSATADWEERYYVIRYGCATFIVLDTNNTSDDAHDNHVYLNDGSTPDWEPGSEQYNWLVSQLRSAELNSAFTFVLGHPSPYTRGVHGAPSEAQSGWHLRALDPLFRTYGVDAVITSHDHLVEHSLTGPPGFEATMSLNDPANLNYLVQGNSGHSARGAAAGWDTWMDIQENDSSPYYTTYFYDWMGTTLMSFLDVNIQALGGGDYQATFTTVRSDGHQADRFILTRSLEASVPEPPGLVLFALVLVGLRRRR